MSILYFSHIHFFSIAFVVSHQHHGKVYPASILLHQRFKVGYIKAGAWAIRVKKMQEYRLFIIKAERQFYLAAQRRC